MEVIEITDGILTHSTIPDTLESLQEIVGGYIEPMFTVTSPYGNGSITGYVNADGIAEQLPLTIGIVHQFEFGDRDNYYTAPVFGNLVITGLTHDGESRDLTAQEIELLNTVYAPIDGGSVFPIVQPGVQKGPFVLVNGILALHRLEAFAGTVA
jgi:hypothetical protein